MRCPLCQTGPMVIHDYLMEDGSTWNYYYCQTCRYQEEAWTIKHDTDSMDCPNCGKRIRVLKGRCYVIAKCDGCGWSYERDSSD